jgi:tetratricopeptide (TPR) repeat protein
MDRLRIALTILTGLFGLAMQAGPNHMRRGQEAFRRGDWARAEESFAAATRERPGSASAFKWLGMVYAAQENFALAEPQFRRACELDPREDLACYYLGRTDYTLSRFEQSRAAFEIALRYQPESHRVKHGLGLALEGLGRIGEAERYLREAAAGGDPRILSDYGQFLMRQGNLRESIAVLKRSGDTESLARAVRVREAAGSQPAAGGPSAPVRFSSTELPMSVKSGATGDMHQIETMIAGVAIFDYDGDGWPDIYVANGATSPGLEKAGASFCNRLFRNRHDGTFTDVTKTAGVGARGYSMGIAAADFDGDDHPDLFVTGVRENLLYRNRGDGTFEDVTEKAGVRGDGRWSVAAAWFDYDNDGRLDLFVVHYVEWDPATEPYCGDLPNNRRSYCHPEYYAPLANALYHNRGDGTFEDVSASSGIGAHRGKGMGVAFADYDHDGLMDIFVANDTVPNFLFHNLGNGRFEEVALRAGVAYNTDGRAVSGMGADFRDVDNDGQEDILMTALSNEGFSLFRNLGGRFSDISQAARVAAASLRLSGWSAGIYDFNNDGLKDLFAANGHALTNSELVTSVESRQSPSLFLNRGDGRFDHSAVGGKALYRGAAFGDLNLDGKIDVVLTRLNEPPVVLTNATEDRNHWLRVRLRGQRSNRDGIGARIRVVTDSGSQWNHVTTSVGYGGSSEPEAHFGLGRSAMVRTLDVWWPSGTRQTLQNVAANRRIEIEEPR